MVAFMFVPDKQHVVAAPKNGKNIVKSLANISPGFGIFMVIYW
jgi:hypothetical protein